MATVLLEPLFASTAAPAAESNRHRYQPDSADAQPSQPIQPHRHLRATHTCSSNPPDTPHSPLHASTASHTTPCSAFTTGVPITATSPFTYGSRHSGHSTWHILQAQPASCHRDPSRVCTTTATSRPISKTTYPGLLAPNRPTLGCQHFTQPPTLQNHPTHTVVQKGRSGRPTHI